MQGVGFTYIDYATAAPRMEWREVIQVLREGHAHARPQQGDVLLGSDGAVMLNRAAFIPGLGYVVKAETTIPSNAARGIPTIQGLVLLFDAEAGGVRAVIDGALVTAFKTAADSALGATLLARADSKHLVIAGAGQVARNLAAAYHAAFPSLERISIWARRPEQAQALAADLAGSIEGIGASEDLRSAMQDADIVATATGARAPILHGDWVRPGTHVDLIGGFTPDMREADNALIVKGVVYVDYLDTTVDIAGDLTQPIADGLISREDVRGDLYDLIGGGQPGRVCPEDITIYKNGGGAHLDLMVANYVARMMGGGEKLIDSINGA